MGVIDIVKYPDPILKRPASPVEGIDGDLDSLIDSMIETMYDAKGIGLAAPQIGRSIRLSVMDVPEGEDYKRGENLIVLINPEIVEAEGHAMHEEGCLSIPGYVSDVPRFRKVLVRALDRNGREITIEGEGLFAIALQHEIDHLNGKLFIDRLSKVKRDIFRRRYRHINAGSG